MPQRYSHGHKDLALRVLYTNRGDVFATSRFTGVPERTLREWRRQYEDWLRRQSHNQQRQYNNGGVSERKSRHPQRH